MTQLISFEREAEIRQFFEDCGEGSVRDNGRLLFSKIFQLRLDLEGLSRRCQRFEELADETESGEALASAKYWKARAEEAESERNEIKYLREQVDMYRDAYNKTRRQVPLPAPNPLLTATVDDEPLESL